MYRAELAYFALFFYSKKVSQIVDIYLKVFIIISDEEIKYEKRILIFK